MGVALSLIGRGEEALPCFDRAAALEPSAAKSYDHKAVTLARLGRVDAAIATLDQGLRQSPGAIDLRFRKGVLLGNAGQHALALALFAEVVRDDPAHPDVWANQADIELREGRTADAMKSIERFLQNNPARIGPRMQAAREKLWSLRNPGVARDPERALELSDRARGMLVLFGDSVMALADLDAATHADPLNGYCWYNRASCLLQVGRVADALASCEQAESLLGATAEVTDLQIAAFMRLERVDDALLCHDRNLAYGKPAADRIHAKVITLMRGHRHGQALSLLQGLIARRPFDIGLRRERAEALAGLHRHADAVAAYDAAIALAPADLSLTAARAALAEKGP
jgi:tetratricopeptide (TPR) repeat protein